MLKKAKDLDDHTTGLCLGLLPEQETLVTKGLNMTPENQPFLKQRFWSK